MKKNISQIIKWTVTFLVVISFMPFAHAQSDEDIMKAVDKVRQYPNSANKKEQLLEKFMKANQSDIENIESLRATGQPDAWYGIYQSYLALENRQNMLRELPGGVLRDMGIVFIDYGENKEEARKKAASYLYAHAEKLLNEEGPQEASRAYFELLKVLKLYDSFREVDVLLRKSIARGAGTVDYDLVNNTGGRLHPVVISKMGEIFTAYENKLPVRRQEGSGADFSIQVVVQETDVSAGQIKKLKYAEERDLLNDNGQVVDTIRCVVDETRQRKSATIRAEIRYRDNRGDVLINRIPVSVESVFLHRFGSLQGDPAAASEQTLELIKAREVDYPSDESMISDAMDMFREKAMSVMLPE